MADKALEKAVKNDLDASIAADAFRDEMVKQADGCIAGNPWWHGWVIMEAFLAGVKYARGEGSEVMTKPITPAQAGKQKAPLPDGVIEAFNELILKHFSGREASFRQDEAITAVARKMGATQPEVFSNHWLDVEEAFGKAGWNVEYDGPVFVVLAVPPERNETHLARFRFSRKDQ